MADELLFESPEGIVTAGGANVFAVPGGGRVVYRLVRHDPPTAADFKPRYSKTAAIALAMSELPRLGLSHYTTLEDIRPHKTEPGSKIAAVTLSNHTHYARTSRLSGHLDVWARVEDLVSSAEVVE